LEGCVKRFLRLLNLGELPDVSSNERYCHRLREMKWEPLVLRRIRVSLLFAYKLIFGIVPLGESLFLPYNPVAAGLCIAGRTRNIKHQMSHPHPIQFNRSLPDGRTCHPADGSFAQLVEKIWNHLSLPPEAYSSIATFSTHMEQLDWTQFPFGKDHLGSAYSAFFLL
jgi:hypothetical protein